MPWSAQRDAHMMIFGDRFLAQARCSHGLHRIMSIFGPEKVSLQDFVLAEGRAYVLCAPSLGASVYTIEF